MVRDITPWLFAAVLVSLFVTACVMLAHHQAMSEDIGFTIPTDPKTGLQLARFDQPNGD